jgi:hypothetical protein
LGTPIDPDEPSVSDLLASVSFLNPAQGTAAEDMPADVWARIQPQLGGFDVMDPATSNVTPLRRRRPIRAIGGLIAASIAMLALSTVVLVDRSDSGSDIVASSDQAAQAAEITASGVNYTARELRSQVRGLLSSVGIERPDRMTRTVAAPTTSSNDDLIRCLRAVSSTMGVTPLVVDRAVYESHGSVLLVVSVIFNEAGEPLLDVIVLDDECDAGNQTMLAHVVYSIDF